MEVDVKIKRYMAASMRAALDQVRAEQGPDAVILSSRRVQGGIEVIAAVDYDEALIAGATRPPAAARTPPAAARTPPAAPVPVAARRPPAAPAAAPRMPPTLAIPVAAEETRRGFARPLQARVFEDLASMDIAPDVAAALAALTPRRTNLGDPSNIPMALLLRALPVVDKLSTVNPGVFAVVGPTGAGKTTTIAKLAARWTMRHGSRDLALVSTDAYRIGAREQLMTYARILGATMHAPNSGPELARVLQGLKSKKLVLIDTAGMGPRDVRLNEQLAALGVGAKGAQFLLALPAQGEGLALEEMIRAFAQVTPTACIITKVDEAATLGAVISTTLRHRLKIAYLCNGQRVPEDVHSAHHRRVWLVRAAKELTRRAPRGRDAAHRARNFGRATAHA
jgi:flagellar biosynthesis protein FlhF